MAPSKQMIFARHHGFFHYSHYSCYQQQHYPFGDLWQCPYDDKRYNNVQYLKGNGRLNSTTPGVLSLPKPPLHSATGNPFVLMHRGTLVSFQHPVLLRSINRGPFQLSSSLSLFGCSGLAQLDLHSQHPGVYVLLITVLTTCVSPQTDSRDTFKKGSTGKGAWRAGEG
jgi:hypothetical protein